MSLTMIAVHSTINPEHPRNLLSVTPVQVANDLNAPVLNGFLVLDSAHEFLSYTDCVVTAVRRLRENEDAVYVHRCSDNELIATKGRRWR